MARLSDWSWSQPLEVFEVNGILFSQDRDSPRFRDGRPVEAMVQDLAERANPTGPARPCVWASTCPATTGAYTA